jgi:opacity protein-like surface antigen
MKRLAFVLITVILLVGFSASGWARAGFWVGPKAVIFYPLNSYLHSGYRTFWGGDAEGGWLIWKRFELGAEVSYIRALGKEEMQETDESGNIVGTFHDENDFLVLSSKAAYRLLNESTPYFGIGLGFYRASDKLVGTSHPYPTISHSALGTQVFAGYDYRVRRWVGFRAEGGFQIAKAKEAHWINGDMGGWKASLGAYLSR